MTSINNTSFLASSASYDALHRLLVYALLTYDHLPELTIFECHDADPVSEVSSPEIDSIANGSPQEAQEQASADQVSGLQEQLASALQRVAAAEKEAAAAKEAAGTELALMRRQLTSSQAGLAEAEQVSELCPAKASVSRTVVLTQLGPCCRLPVVHVRDLKLGLILLLHAMLSL